MEADAPEQGVAGDGGPPPQRHTRLQRQQLEDAGAGTQTSHHLRGWWREQPRPLPPALGDQREPPPHLPAQTGWRCWPWTCGAQGERPNSGLRPGQAVARRGSRGRHCAGPCPYLCMVCEATRKDMRSPGESSSPAIREPPTKMVPRTIPVGRRVEVGPGGGPAPQHHRVLPHGTHSPLSARLESPWKAAMPIPSRSFSQPARSTSAQYSLRAGTGLTPPQPPATPTRGEPPLPPYPACWSSMAKARTVRTFPSTSSATPVALATCGDRDGEGGWCGTPPAPAPRGWRGPLGAW